MHRFFVSPEEISQEGANHHLAHLNGEEFKHLSRVLRLQQGEEVTLFDGRGWEYTGEIISLQKDEALIRIKDSHFLPRESSLDVWLVQGIPKGEKMELIIQKATELGIRGIIPLKTQRCIVKLDQKKEVERRKRWQKVALEAVKQCGRSLIPTVMPSCTLQEFLRDLPPQRQLYIPWEEGGASFKEELKKAFAEVPGLETERGKVKTPVFLVIGPEGGFAEEEVLLVQNYGGIAVSLGPRILRTETAGIAALAALMFAWGDWG